MKEIRARRLAGALRCFRTSTVRDINHHQLALPSLFRAHYSPNFGSQYSVTASNQALRQKTGSA